MNFFCLFEVKKKIKQKIFYKKLVKEDKQIKESVYNKIFELKNGLIPGIYSEEDFIISLTSYGNRVENSLPYALYSLVNQTLVPKTIVVYLSQDEWNDNNLPKVLAKFKDVGVEYRFCEDIKSFKKIIPALIDFPNNPIITFDDDFYYDRKYIEFVRSEYDNSDKKTVLGQWGCIPEKKDGEYIPYNKWRDGRQWTDGDPISFFGCGCCYPPHIFDQEVLNKEVFMKLCPKADDIWLWAMEERLGIKRKYIGRKGMYHRPVDQIFEYLVGQDNSLTMYNVLNGENDIQLHNLLEYYNI